MVILGSAMISPAQQTAQWSRRLLLVTTAIFVVGVILGSLLGTDGFLVASVFWLPVWVCCLVVAFVALWRSSDSALGRRARTTALGTIVALAFMMLVGIVVVVLTNMLSVTVRSG